MTGLSGVKYLWNKMEKEFLQIKQKYGDFYDSLLRQGQLVYRNTDVGIWGAAVTDEVFNLFKKIKLHNFKNFLDLGSGDGKVVMIASLFGLKATGIEYDKWLVENTLKIRNSLMHLPHVRKTKFLQKNYYDHDFSNYDIVFCNPDEPMYRNLEGKMLKELKGHLVVYGPHFHPRHLRKLQTIDIQGTLVSVFSQHE